MVSARALPFRPKPRSLADTLQELIARDPQWIEKVKVLAEWRLKELDTPRKVS